MKVLVLDNYDSFTYNLVHLVHQVAKAKVDVVLNDRIDLDEVEDYDHIILSPGPGLPSEAGKMPALIRRYAASKTILGVCLGHQAIGEAFGARLLNLPTVFHGRASSLNNQGEWSAQHSPNLFRGLPPVFPVARYHSWVISDLDFPSSLEITARDEHGNIMAIAHRQYNVQGLQFHPESILTPHGMQMMRNWLAC